MRAERRNAYVVGEDPSPVQPRKYLSNIYPPSLLLTQVSHAQYRGLVGWLLVPGLGLSVSACDANRLTTTRNLRIPAHRSDIARLHSFEYMRPAGEGLAGRWRETIPNGSSKGRREPGALSRYAWQ